MKPVNEALADWAKENGVELAFVAFEYYINDPSEDPSIIPMTETRFPIK